MKLNTESIEFQEFNREKHNYSSDHFSSSKANITMFNQSQYAQSKESLNKNQIPPIQKLNRIRRHNQTKNDINISSRLEDEKVEFYKKFIIT